MFFLFTQLNSFTRLKRNYEYIFAKVFSLFNLLFFLNGFELVYIKQTKLWTSNHNL